MKTDFSINVQVNLGVTPEIVALVNAILCHRPTAAPTAEEALSGNEQVDNKPGSQDNNSKRRNVRPGSNGRGRGVSQKKTSEKSTTRKVTPIVNPQKKENVVKKFIKRIFGFKK